LRAEAGSRGQFVFTFEAGKGGIGPSGHLAVQLPFTNVVIGPSALGGRRRTALEELQQRYQAAIDVRCSCPGPIPEATLGFHMRDYGLMFGPILDILLRGYGLEEGDRVDIVLGAPEYWPLVVPAHSLVFRLPTAIDVEGSGIYHRIADTPRLEVIGGRATHLDAIAPAMVEPEQPFQVSVVALDGVRAGQPPMGPGAADGENPASGYAGQVVLHAVEGESAPSVVSDSDASGATRVFTVTCETPGLKRFSAVDLDDGLAGSSNYTCCGSFDDSVGGLRLYFGDIHTHGYNCDGLGTLHEAYHWARDVRHLDFAARTNHAEGIKTRRVEDFWPEVLAAARHYYEPGRFVPLLGFEWGGWELFGDRCVYYRRDEGPVFGGNHPQANTPQKLWQALEGYQALTIPHHSKFIGHTNWDYHDPRFQRLVEIYSAWGFSEHGGSTCVQAAWAKGLRMGVICSSDEHWGEPGNHWGGMACVWAPDLTREAIFDGLWARRCYGTTGARILLAFSINGQPMGQELATKPGAHLAIRARVAGTSPIRELVIVRNNQDVWSRQGLGRTALVEVEESVPSPGSCFYYLRVTQEDHQVAWSSPIWVDVHSDAPSLE